MSIMNETIQRSPRRRGDSSSSAHSWFADETSRKNSALSPLSGLRDSDISSELDLQSVMRASLAIQEGPQVKNIILKLVHIIMQTAGANYGCVMLREQSTERKTLHIEVIGNENKVNVVDHKPLHSQTDVVPARLCEYHFFDTYTNGRAVARLGEPIIRNGDTPSSNYRFDSIYGKDAYFRNNNPASILCMPISKLGGIPI